MGKPKKKSGTLLIVLGLLLLAAAFAVTAYNIWDSNRAGEAAAEILEVLELPVEVQPATPVIHKTLEEVTVEYPPMATEKIYGYDYIGRLEVPVLKLNLPVMNGWDYDRMQISPCVYTGSYFSADLVICAHNYPTHFGNLRTVDLGTDIYLTTVDGYRYHYQVDNIESVKPTDISKMVTSTDWDLTLFTCHTDGQTRCAIRCTMLLDEFL